MEKNLTEFYQKLEEMTDNNFHGIAREFIAKTFELDYYEKIFKNINSIHDTMGGMDCNLLKFREETLKNMLATIGDKNKWIAKEIHDRL